MAATSISCMPSCYYYSVTAATSSKTRRNLVGVLNPIHQDSLGTKTLKTPSRLRSSFSTAMPVLRLRVRASEVASAETASSTSTSPSSEAARTLYIGNIPRTVTSDQLARIVQEHGAVEKAEVMYDKYSQRSRRFGFATMKTVEDANAAIDKLDATEIGGRKIKVNITEKPLPRAAGDATLLQADDSQFVDSPHKVYVGNLAKTVTTQLLQSFFSDKAKVLSAKVSRVPGTSKPSGYGFVTFSSEEDVDLAISSFNDSVLEGQKIRVNKAS